MRGAKKLHDVVKAVRAAVTASVQVSNKLLARLLGSIYSRKLLMHRAVPIMTRAMFDMLAVQIRLDLKPWFDTADRLTSHMAAILKHTWNGTSTWTSDQEDELRFWESVTFIEQKAPMHFDAVDDDLRHVIAGTDTKVQLQKDVRIIAADTSDHATGIAEFVLDDKSRLHPKVVASVPLACDESTLNSTICELLG